MSFDFIPLEVYTTFYYYTILMVIFFISYDLGNLGYRNAKFGFLLVFVLILYMGFRPISGDFFGDMGAYSRYFEDIRLYKITVFEKDIVFSYFMLVSSKIMSVNFFFLTCAFLYIFPLYLVCKKWFREFWFYVFLFLIGSFSFWNGGVNGIRNSMAGSIFLFGISQEKRLNQIVWILLSIGIHKSMVLPTLGLVISQFYNKPKMMIAFWLSCIPLSLAAGGFWETFFAGLGFEDERLSYLTEGNISNEDFSGLGFRWDFLLYSSTAVYAGWFFIVKKHFQDKIYLWLFNTYVFANGFWILVIRANFSNRFAYLSWFMMALVIAYPLVKNTSIIPSQNKVLARVLLAYFSFTFLMNVILSQQ